jgi:hypothetical protein
MMRRVDNHRRRASAATGRRGHKIAGDRGNRRHWRMRRFQGPRERASRGDSGSRCGRVVCSEDRECSRAEGYVGLVGQRSGGRVECVLVSSRRGREGGRAAGSPVVVLLCAKARAGQFGTGQARCSRELAVKQDGGFRAATWTIAAGGAGRERVGVRVRETPADGGLCRLCGTQAGRDLVGSGQRAPVLGVRYMRSSRGCLLHPQAQDLPLRACVRACVRAL